jgi:hypothetical protein
METKRKEEILLGFKAKMEFEKAQRLENIKNYWENLKPFINASDVPDIPITSIEQYREYYVPKLIKSGAIPKNQLIHGQVYYGNHRQCTIAKWNAEKNIFEYWRHKFQMTYIDTCNHFEDDDGFAVFVPIAIKTEEDFENTK